MPLASYKEVLLPRLHPDEYRITSPESDRYNCIAWAAGDATRRWWPGEPDYYWPPDAPQGETLEVSKRSLRPWAIGNVPLTNGSRATKRWGCLPRRLAHPRRPAVAQRSLEQQAGLLGGHRT